MPEVGVGTSEPAGGQEVFVRLAFLGHRGPLDDHCLHPHLSARKFGKALALERAGVGVLAE